MSWSVQIVGVPNKIAAELDAYETTLTGASLDEFKEVKPHLQALVSQNVGQSLVRLDASGHASFGSQAPHPKTSGNCSVTLAPFYGKVAV
jgi:hypothetical protein